MTSEPPIFHTCCPLDPHLLWHIPSVLKQVGPGFSSLPRKHLSCELPFLREALGESGDAFLCAACPSTEDASHGLGFAKQAAEAFTSGFCVTCHP